jgi:hypothetical protein
MMAGRLLYRNHMKQLRAMWRRLRAVAGQTQPQPPRVAFEPLEARLQLAVLTGDETVPGALEGDRLPDLAPLASRTQEYIHGWSIDRHEKPGRTLLRLTTAMANFGAGPLELRGGRVVDGAQQVFQRIYQEDRDKPRDRLAGDFTYHPEHGHTHFDDFAAYRLRVMREDGGVGRIAREGSKVSFCLTDSDPVDTDLPGAPLGGEYDSCSTDVQGISVGWADVYSQSLDDQWIDVTGLKSGEYWLEVVVDPANRILESNENNNVKRIKIKFRRIIKPANDDFAARGVLSGRSASVAVSNVGATFQEWEPEHTGVEGGQSVWWTWTAPASGRVVLSTADSNFDTLLGVYKGNSLVRLKEVASNDDDPDADRTSRLSFKATAGVTYQIAVDGYRGASGMVRLSLRMP